MAALAGIWFGVRRALANRRWAAREALRCYRAALAYCAACDAEADAHEEAERALVAAATTER